MSILMQIEHTIHSTLDLCLLFHFLLLAAATTGTRTKRQKRRTLNIEHSIIL